VGRDKEEVGAGVGGCGGGVRAEQCRGLAVVRSPARSIRAVGSILDHRKGEEVQHPPKQQEDVPVIINAFMVVRLSSPIQDDGISHIR
jgi:hypothetical protein